MFLGPSHRSLSRTRMTPGQDTVNFTATRLQQDGKGLLCSRRVDHRRPRDRPGSLLKMYLPILLANNSCDEVQDRSNTDYAGFYFEIDLRAGL